MEFMIITALVLFCCAHSTVSSSDCWSDIDSSNTASVICSGIGSSNVDVLLAVLDDVVTATGGSQMNLEIANSNVTDLPITTLAGYPIRALILYDNHLATVPTTFLQSVDPQLLILDLSHNVINNVQPADFDALPFKSNLEILLLSDNQIDNLPTNTFTPFINLQKLRLQFNQISLLTGNSIANMAELTELQLYANQIVQVSEDAFGSLPKLRLLFLNGNSITTFENGTFSDEKFPALEKIFLGNNPFDCECTLQWFKNWLISRSLDVGSDPTCVYPSFNPFEFIDFCSSNSTFDGVLQDYKEAYLAHVQVRMMNNPRKEIIV